ncbi:MAG: alpha/beta fold hydrolase [Acidobacteria bacterium]|nr:alpha/beta fold hydrolase [Acidobacteriota bacterium]
MKDLYPQIDPFDEGMLPVSPVHTLYYEQSGNPKGAPVVFLHGGPGGGTVPDYRRFFDPEAYRIILFDQRGSGKSTPHASLEENTTWHLVEDMEKLREHLGVDDWHVFGGSWGSTLALAYAQTHPARKLYPDPDLIDHFGDAHFATAFARIECHYFTHDSFFPTDNYLIENVDKIRDIPAVIVQGRYDVVCPIVSAWELHSAWAEADFQIIHDAGHSALEPGIRAALVAATDKFRGR